MYLSIDDNYSIKYCINFIVYQGRPRLIYYLCTGSKLKLGAQHTNYTTYPARYNLFENDSNLQNTKTANIVRRLLNSKVTFRFHL